MNEGASGTALHLLPDADGQWILPEGFTLFTADFGRDLHDLLLQTEGGDNVRLEGYFATQAPADLLSADGAILRGGLVERLAGPMFPAQYAQSGSAALAEAIGQVETLEGLAFVQRTDGQVVELAIGAKVFQGDVVRTDDGGTLGLTFADGTIFTLASGSRIVLDELIYDPLASDNSGVFGLIEGSFVFIAGQAAKTGGIEINTPAATMGIRGTTGKIDIETVNGVATVTVSLNPDPDSGLGVIELYDLSGNLISSITGTETQWVIRPPFTNEPPIEIRRDSIDLSDDAPLLDQALAAYEAAVGRVTRGQEFVEFSDAEQDQQEGDPEQSEKQTDPPPEEGQQQQQPGAPEEEAPEDAEPPRPAPLDEDGDAGDGTGGPGSGNPELDGVDEQLLDQGEGAGGEDDASLEDGNDPVIVTQNDSGARSDDIEVQGLEDNALTNALPLASTTETPVTVTQNPSNGEVVITDNGTFVYTPNENFSGTDNFTIAGTDDRGSPSEAEITVVVDPVNDAPTVGRQLVSEETVEEGSDPGTGSGTVNGTLTYVDVDEGSAPGVWSIAAAAGNTSALGAISINAQTGFWQYDLDQSAADALLQGDVVEESFTATVTDAEGATDVSIVVITVTGTNDNPVITSAIGQTTGAMVTGPSVTEVTDPEVSTNGSVSGTLNYSDVDEGETAALWSISADPENQTALGVMSIDAATGEWHYDLPNQTPTSLVAGQTVTEIFTATVTDAQGGTAVQEIVIEITGTNEIPTIVFSIEDVSATVVEDGFVEEDNGSARIDPNEQNAFGRSFRSDQDAAQVEIAQEQGIVENLPNATGRLRYVDVDGDGGAGSWSVAAQDASMGNMTIDASTGDWRYFLDEQAANSLREGDEVVETFVATITDPFGASASQVITITVQGSNDAAELVATPADLRGNVTEDAGATASGTLNFVDPDALAGETATWSVSPDGPSRGSMQIDANTGQWIYTLGSVASQSLSAARPETETFTATVTDTFGATTDQTIIITLNGQNDGPVMVSGSGSIEKTHADVAIDLSVLGSDIDLGEDGNTLSYSVSVAPSQGSASVSGTDLIFSTDNDFNDLSEGQSRNVTVRVTATDDFGATASSDVVITVIGSDTGPVITSTSADAEGTAVEAGASGPGTAIVSGTLTYDDPDATTSTSGVWSAVPRSAVFGTLSIDQTTGDWVYTLDNTAADALNEGQTAQDIFRATITDEDGQAAQQDIIITITGANDAPALVGASGSLLESDPSLTLDLSFFAQDADTENTGTNLTYDLDSGPGVGNGSATLSAGTLVFSTGSDFDGLSEGQAQTVTISIGVTDAQGLRSVSDVLITVTGTQSAPLITSSAAVATGAVTETGTTSSGETTASGTLTYTDPDGTGPFSGTWSVTPDTSALGQITIDPLIGNWVYTLNDAAADSLAQGDVVQEQFTATITDADGLTDTQTITINIAGHNDHPTVAALNDTAQEDGPTISINLNGVGSDVDETGALSYILVDLPGKGIAQLVGNTIQYDPNGAFEALTTGQSETVEIGYAAQDTQGAQSETGKITITVQGQNDAPIVSDLTGNVMEDGPAFLLDLTGVGSDVDTPGALTYIVVNVPGSGFTQLLGNTVRFDPVGDFETLAAGQTGTVEIGYKAQDALGADSAVHLITLSVQGQNDAPLLAAGTISATEDGGALTLDLATLGTDVDNGESGATLSYSIDDVVGEASLSGSIMTFDPGFGFQGLAEGETQDLTVSVTARDEALEAANNTVVVTVTGVNDTALFANGAATVGEADGATSINLSSLVTDADNGQDGTTKTYEIVSGPPVGKGSVLIDGLNVIFNPGDDFLALDSGETEDVSFTVRALDIGRSDLVSNTATITVTITGENNGPTASDFTVSHPGGAGALSIDAFAHVVDDVDTQFSFVSIGTPSFGGAVIDDAGTPSEAFDDIILYTPNAVTDGSPDTLTYTVQDSAGNQDTGTITINVPANAAPTATDVTASATLVSRAGASYFADGDSYYEFVRGYYEWDAARADAASKGGHLGVITSVEENTFAAGLLTVAGGDINAWLGGNDAATEGQWFWVDGPETGALFWQGDETGSSVGMFYENWAPGQPVVGGSADQDHLSMSRFGGAWDDVRSIDPRGYLLEYESSSASGTLNPAGIGEGGLGGGEPLTYTLNAPVTGLTLNTNGVWEFDRQVDTHLELEAGETADIVAQYTVTDERGATATANFTITVSGVNDGPTVADDTAAISLSSQAPLVGGDWTQWASAIGGNDHYYQFVETSLSWDDARAEAAAQGGYLVTITSAGEQAFVASLFGTSPLESWLGASDSALDGEWRWVEGPDAGTHFWLGDSSGSAPGGAYENWNASFPTFSATDNSVFSTFDSSWSNDNSGTATLNYIMENSSPGPATGSVATNDSDPEGDTITYALSGTYDGLTMAADGSWSFDRTTDAYDDLAGGETLVINAYYTATDSHGASSDGQLRLTLTGANEAPVLGADAVAIALTVDDGPTGGGWSQWTSATGGNDHYYQYISGSRNWADASADAAALGGHLVTITSSGEQAFVNTIGPGGAIWLGGFDLGSDNTWHWVEGPEAGDQFSSGSVGVSGAYVNWSTGEPNDTNHDALHRYSDGRWGDTSAATPLPGYILEYSTVAPITGTLATNDSDAEGDTISYTLNDTYAGLTLQTDGSWSFDRTTNGYNDLAAGDTRVVKAYYTATDGNGGSSIGHLEITLTGANSDPVLGADSQAITLAVGSSAPTGGGWSQWTSGAGANNHYYQYVAGTINWANAETDAAARGGHLATITSAAEQAFIDGLRASGAQSIGWLGGSDAAVEGEWRWVAGPEDGDQFWQGESGGSAVNGSYTNWHPDQPLDGTFEHYLHIWVGELWNDIGGTTDLAGYYLEYSGVPLVTGSIAGNDSDPDGDTITYNTTNTVDGLTLDTAGNWSFDKTHSSYSYLGAGETATITQNYTATDGNGGSTDGAFSIVLTGVNDAPEFSDIDFGSVAETAGFQSLDLLSAVVEPDSSDNLSVQNFTFNWSGDGPTPTIVPVGDQIVEIDPGDFTSLRAGETASLSMTYDVFDGTIAQTRTATFEITGATTPIVANSNNLSPSGVSSALTDEDTPTTISSAVLLANDSDPEGLGISIVGVTGFNGVHTTGFSHNVGAYLTLSGDGSSISYDPTMSALLNDLGGSGTDIDSFYYTIESGDGLQQHSAEVVYVITGVASSDLAPEAFAITGTGFTTVMSDEFTINPLFMRDVDDGSGMRYKFGMSTVDGALPGYLDYDLTNRLLSVDSAQFTAADAGVTNLILSGFEADGDYAFSPFSLVLDTNGDILYTRYGFGDTFGITNLVEVGVDPSVGSGDIGDGVDFDLSGLDAQTPNTLRDLEVLQLQNSQENDVEIDSAALLALIDGNAANANEQIQITVDSFDNISFETTTDWSADIAPGGGSVQITGTGGDFAGLGVIATLMIDGGTLGGGSGGGLE